MLEWFNHTLFKNNHKIQNCSSLHLDWLMSALGVSPTLKQDKLVSSLLLITFHKKKIHREYCIWFFLRPNKTFIFLNLVTEQLVSWTIHRKANVDNQLWKKIGQAIVFNRKVQNNRFGCYLLNYISIRRNAKLQIWIDSLLVLTFQNQDYRKLGKAGRKCCPD